MRLFLSHAWVADEVGRDTHARVRRLRDLLQARRVDTWFDEDHMVDDVDACMTSGIERSDVFCVCLTRGYCAKVDRAARDPRVRDSCYKEFSYAQTIGKRTVCVVFEPSMCRVSSWPNGIVKLYLGNKLYVDGAGDDLEETAERVVRDVQRGSHRTPAIAPPARVAPLYTPTPFLKKRRRRRSAVLARTRSLLVHLLHVSPRASVRR